jgi:hypothetical protein
MFFRISLCFKIIKQAYVIQSSEYIEESALLIYFQGCSIKQLLIGQNALLIEND